MNNQEKFWDKTAKKYSQSDIKDKEGYNKTLEETRKYLDKEKVVLEVGCGTGTTALLLAGHTKELTSTDISSNMIEIAKEKAKKENVGNINFVQATLSDHTFKNESFDVILAYNLIHLLEDTDQVMKDVYKLLKPGGIFISKTPCLKEKNFIWPILVPIVSTVLRTGCIKCFTIADLESSMKNTGFEVLDRYVQFPKPPRLFAVAKKLN